MKKGLISLIMTLILCFSGMAIAQNWPISVDPNPIVLGYRPNNCWMRPMVVTVSNDGTTCSINTVDFSNDYFVVENEMVFPFTLAYGDSFDINIGWTEGNGQINANLVVDYSDNRTAAVFDVTAMAYTPVCPDVFEMARIVNNYPFTETVSVSQTPLYDNYMLPPTSVQDGPDAVWKLTFEEDQLLNASVDGENGKIAVYTEDFYESEFGFAGPDVNNNYVGFGSQDIPSGEPYDIIYGAETTNSSGYYPCYNYYCNSLTEQLYRAENLHAAGMNAGTIQTIGFCSMSSYSSHLTGVKIWMANVADTEVTPMSHLASNMTCVYEGTFDPMFGWNDFTLNRAFAWDGTSNLLVMFQMNNGMWGNTIYYKRSEQGYIAGFIDYNDFPPYEPENNSYMASDLTTYVANTHFVGGGRTSADRDVTASIDSLIMVPGTYYLVASATSDEFTVNINAETMPCPEEMTAEANLVAPLDDEDDLDPASVELKWHLSNYTTEYRLLFGSTYYCEEVLVPWTNNLAESYTLTDLYNNTNYFWRIEERNDGCPEGISSPVWGFTTHLNVPTNLHSTSENYNNLYEGETLHLAWNAIEDRTFRQYNIYQDGELIGSTSINTNTRTYDVEGLTYNMNGYAFNVTALYDEGESDFSNTLIIRVSGEGEVDGYVYEQDGVTGIADATVTKTGRDVYGRTHTYTFTTEADGHYHGSMQAGQYSGVASCPGYVDVPYEFNPFEITYGIVLPDVNYIMDEVFAPVGEVIAEYYPDPNDPESPYVKVYWGQGIAGLIEDFETGDFSSFNWNVSGEYPFEITTTNPYEGDYCMQSTNYNVPSSTSSIDVNVEIPYDGVMSFYRRISCEGYFDNAYFYIDDVEIANFSGDLTSWARFEVPVTEGIHNFKWTYVKDYLYDIGEDRFFVDYINFISHDEPIASGWHTYAESEFTDATGAVKWAYCYPLDLVSQYAGFNLTKVALYSDNLYSAVGGNYTCSVYVGGTLPDNGTLVSSITVDVPANLDAWVEYDLTNPVHVSGSEILWVTWTVNNAYSGFPAGMAAGSDANGTWWNTGEGWSQMYETYYMVWTMKNYFTNRSGRTVEASFTTAEKASKNESIQMVDDAPLIPVKNHVSDHKTDSQVLAQNPNYKSVSVENNNDRAFSHYRVYRTDCYNYGPYTLDNTVVLSCELHDTLYIDVDWANLADGVYKWGVGCVYSGNRDELQEPRESPIVWSNCLDKGMYLSEGDVTVNVLLNSADSPEGVNVKFTNDNAGEQQQHPIEPITLDETGFYAFDSFRKGDYIITITKDGYEPIEEHVSIWDATDLRYVMTEIIYGIDNLYVSSTGWAMWEDATVGPQPGPTPGDTEFTEGFEGGLNGWNVINGIDSEVSWVHSDNNPAGYDYSSFAHGGTGFAMAYSFDEWMGSCFVDSYLCTPQKYSIGVGSTLTFWADNCDDFVPEEFSVCVSMADNPTSNDFIEIWYGSAKGKKGTGNREHRSDNWRQHTIDLSDYAGEQVYIAFHDLNFSMYEVWIDDVQLSAGRSDDRHLEYYKVMCTSIDGQAIFNADTEHPFCQVATDELVPGDHYICKVAAVYSTGMSDWAECEWAYIPCYNYAGTTEGVVEEDDQTAGNHFSWTYPTGPGPVPPTPDDFTFGFEEDPVANGWTIQQLNETSWVRQEGATGFGAAPHEGSYHMWLHWAYGDQDEWLITPEFTVPANGNLNFWTYATLGSTYGDHYYAKISVDGGNTWTVLWDASAQPAGENYYTSAINCDLSAYAGQTAKIAWQGVMADGLWYAWCIDDITVSGNRGVISFDGRQWHRQPVVATAAAETVAYSKAGDIEPSSNRAMWDLIGSMSAYEPAHYGVVSDGEYIYTSNWGYASAQYNFCKYDMDGNFIEGFNIAGCGTIRDLDYDGEFFYGGANSNVLYTIDLANHVLVNTTTTGCSAIRHCSYDPQNDGFWVGGWDDLMLIDRNGSVIQNAPAPSSCAGSGYYQDENGNGHVYLWCEPQSVYDYNVANNNISFVTNLTNVPGWDGSSTAGGAFVGAYNGLIAFYCNIQQSPNVIGIYELSSIPGPVPPTPEGDVIGAMIFRDGEWLAEVAYPTSEYIDTDEFERHEYCVRLIYNGTNTLPEGNIYYSMSCPECAEIGNGETQCAAGADIRGEYQWHEGGEFGALISWGEQVEPIAEWLYYDNGTYASSVGTGSPSPCYWGIMIPATSLSAYDGCNLTQVAVFDAYAATYTCNIYYGGNTPVQGTLVHTQDLIGTGSGDWVYADLSSALPLDVTSNLWITFFCNSLDYPMAGCNNTGDANGRWVSLDGTTWEDISSYSLNYTWMIRGFVTNQAKGGSITALEPFQGGASEGTFKAIAGNGNNAEFDFGHRAAQIVKYNVYRSTSNADYALIGSVNAVAGQEYYEYFDEIAAGSYYYQVTAVYDNDCESEPALAEGNHANNYVIVNVTAVAENNGIALYPNPTSGNVKIEAVGMNHITVVSALGQVVYDAEVSCDEMNLNMAQFNAGIYMVRIITENSTIQGRIVKE